MNEPFPTPCFRHLVSVCAALVLLGSAHPAAASDNRCGSLCTEEFWREASPADVATALEGGASITAWDRNGASPLHWAAAYGRQPGMASLLAAGADVDARSFVGFRPLHWWAIWSGDAAVFEALLAAGADLHARDGLGFTPLHEAAEESNLASVKALLDAGADVNARNGGGGGPILMAAYRGQDEVVELLLAAGADANQRGDVFAHSEWERGEVTPLHMAASALVDYVSSPEATERVTALLLKSGAEINAEDWVGRTPLDDAIEQDNAAVQSLLRSHGGVCKQLC